MKHLIGVLFFAAVGVLAIAPAGAGVVYSNDFETNTDGFDVTDTSMLPSDDVGGTSTYLGLRTPVTTSAVLSLTGLAPGTTYYLAFDVFIGGTWDGSLSPFGPDFFSLTTSSAGILVDATFRNGFPIGDLTPGQTYSDATPLGDGGLFRTREGADVELGEPIYTFGRGDGNPYPSFVAADTTETVTFTATDAQGVSDEFFALDNVEVSTVPEPAHALLLLTGALVLVARRSSTDRMRQTTNRA